MTGLFGASLITASGLMSGLLMAKRLRDRVTLCGELCSMLELMVFELERFRTPLPELFSGLSERLGGETGALCGRVADGLCGGESFCGIWKQALSGLPPQERDMLMPLASVLGRYGAQEQTAAVTGCLSEMRLHGERLRRAAAEKSRVYIGALTAAALMLAVLLL